MLAAIRNPWLKWGAIALIQILLVATPLAERIGVHMSGREVTLAMRPVDPRDLLRGDYVIVNLEINRIEPELFAKGEALSRGDIAYVALEADAEGIARPVRVSGKPPQDGRLAIRGRIASSPSSPGVAMDYGLDAFYVPEGAGRAIERIDAGQLRLVIALTKQGKSAPLRITLDGKTLVEESAF